MASVYPETDPIPLIDGEVAERLRRLEEKVAANDIAAPSDEEMAQRVIAILAEKAAQQRVLIGPPPVPGLVPTALTAAGVAHAVVTSNHAPPGVVPPSSEAGIRSWLLTQVVTEFRLIARMYFDPRYRLSRVAQIGVPIVLALMVLNYFTIGWIFYVGFLLERIVLVFLSVILYKILSREAARYRQVIDYLSHYGYG